MPSGLHRTYGAHHLHLITCSCYHRLPFLRSARARDRFLSILEQTRQRYRFVVVGYVVMPEHIHLLLTEPEVGSPSTVMQVVKQRTARALLPRKKRRDPRQRELFGEEPRRVFWQVRFYDPFGFAQDFGSGLRRPLIASTSTYGRRRSAWRS
jgi:putative transposase